MRVKNLFLFVLLPLFVIGAAGAGYYFLSHHENPKVAAVIPALNAAFGWKFPTSGVKFPSTGSAAGGDLAYSSLPDPGGVPSGLPLHLKIPIIGVDSTIEDALITPDGRMDVPAGTIDVAWFALGPQPGEVGSAVIGGHYGIQNGIPFVFYNLNKLKVGDMIYTTNDKGAIFTFVVRSTASYSLNADATPVFTSNDGLAHLNLITCEGVWNEVNGNYPDRLVIFTDLVPTVGTFPVGAISTSSVSTLGLFPTSIVFGRSLGIGTAGADVVTLQTFLEQRGLLELPPGVTNGYFGMLTSAALARYQTSVGLPGVGVLGPLTRAKLNAALGNNLGLPTTGLDLVSSTPTSTENSNTAPLEEFITSLLLIAIAFLAFKIIKR